MITTLLETPTIYKQTEGAFWDDPHISKQMLNAHLDPEFEGASRKADFIDQSAQWISTLFPSSKYPTLLDLGCGPGIYSEKFTQSGYKVTGLDFSKRSINYGQDSAKKKQLEIDYRYENYLVMDLQKKFDLITMIYCDYGALSEENRKILLDKIFHHLKPKGKVLFDVFSLTKFMDFEEKQTWESNPKGGFWTAEPHIALNNYLKYNNNVTLEQTSILTENKLIDYYLWTTYFTQETLMKEVCEAGFSVVDVFGDVKGSLYKKDSPTLAIVLEKQSESNG
ncbi:hypothetical protein A5844_000929 [Enterococcus sp. 10A9_DIV0425]|uniref:Methyltransferase domain-containing protein n=1 Tax=Candidatus Enterococcus wittei TaxID=1987383 RepID=A0A242JWW3_9ENTE|nr:methyltransferase domain-containing protein [Enterococcus sp. 10A9_DIV0425]OTP06772.1 hypothetical protein A5844_002712 [Enterococcus sp. 10A9_DIV0425]OTP10795.1 hypothetical protein A5844_000929 [Enterococcus sp. 10A9_DIV0425]